MQENGKIISVPKLSNPYNFVFIVFTAFISLGKYSNILGFAS
jgi:hypothetical protein